MALEFNNQPTSKLQSTSDGGGRRHWPAGVKERSLNVAWETDGWGPDPAAKKRAEQTALQHNARSLQCNTLTSLELESQPTGCLMADGLRGRLEFATGSIKDNNP